MPGSYDLGEARFIINGSSVSAADALVIPGPICPAGKMWTILSASFMPSVNETQQVWWEVVASSGAAYPITVPTSMGLNPTTGIACPALTYGMEITIYPGERIRGRRAAATGGSTITAYYRYIESDLPIYRYREPQRQLAEFRRGNKYGTALALERGESPASGGPGTGGTGSISTPAPPGAGIPGRGLPK